MFIGRALGVRASTVARVLSRYDALLPRELDPVTGKSIRARRSSARRYEHAQPGSLVHIDVKKPGRIPAGAGWRAHSRSERVRGRGISYGYIHAAIDDRSCLAYAEIHPTSAGRTCAAFVRRAIAFYVGLGAKVERVIIDSAFAYRHSAAFGGVPAEHGIARKYIRLHCTWTNGRVERLNRTLGQRAESFSPGASSQGAPRPWQGTTLQWRTRRMRPCEPDSTSWRAARDVRGSSPSGTHATGTTFLVSPCALARTGASRDGVRRKRKVPVSACAHRHLPCVERDQPFHSPAKSLFCFA